MPAYMYLRETPSTAPLKEQIKYAQEHQIAEEHMPVSYTHLWRTSILSRYPP